MRRIVLKSDHLLAYVIRKVHFSFVSKGLDEHIHKKHNVLGGVDSFARKCAVSGMPPNPVASRFPAPELIRLTECYLEHAKHLPISTNAISTEKMSGF